MKLLLDTHIFLWGLLDPSRLNDRVASELESEANELWLSPVSTWETMLLAERGRIVLDTEPRPWLRSALRTLALKEAPLTHEVALLSRSVDLPHQDPADRFLVATAQAYQLTLVTADDRLIGCPDLKVLANT